MDSNEVGGFASANLIKSTHTTATSRSRGMDNLTPSGAKPRTLSSASLLTYNTPTHATDSHQMKLPNITPVAFCAGG